MALKIFFGTLACDYIHESGREIKEVAALVPKTPQNQFSKWKSGQWTYIAEKKLLQLIDAVAGRDREKRAALMIAYLIDMTPEPFRPLIDIKPVSGAPDPEKPTAGMRLPSGLRDKLEEIGRAYARDADFKRMADSLGDFATAINKRADKG